MRRAITLLAVISIAVTVFLGCSGDVTLSIPADLEGMFLGTYEITVDYGTVRAQTYTQPISWLFSDSIYVMQIDTSRPYDSAFHICRVDGRYSLSEGVRLRELHFYPDITATACAEKNNPRGDFTLIKSNNADTLRMSQFDREHSLYKEIIVARQP